MLCTLAQSGVIELRLASVVVVQLLYSVRLGGR